MPPQMPIGDLMRLVAPNPADVQALQNTSQQMQDQSTAAQDRLSNINSEFMPIPQQHQSQFQNFITDNLQKQLTSELAKSQAPSRSDKFNRGWDMGQKLAANLVIPLMGLHAKGLGSAAGANAAMESLKGQVAQSEQNRKAQEHAHNNTVMNLAQMYEKMDPNSAANIADLLGRQVQAMNYNKTVKQEAQKNSMDALDKVAGVQEKLAGINSTGNKETANVIQRNQEQNIGVAGLGLRGQEFQQKSGKDAEELGNQKSLLGLKREELKVSQGSLAARQGEIQSKMADSKTDNERADLKLQLEATQQLERYMRINATNAMAPGVGGAGKKFANYSEFLEKNPAEKQMFNTLAKAAGMKNVDPDKVFSALRAQNAVEAQPDWWKQILQTVAPVAQEAGNMQKSLLGISPPAAAAAPAVVPPEEIMKARGFKKDKDGKWVK